MQSKKLAVLVIDDDISIRSMLGLVLEQAGYSVVLVASSQAAISSLQTASFQVIILDMGMPPNEHNATEGIKVLDFICQNQVSSKVIVLTGQNAEETSYLAIRHGAFDFLAKPVDTVSILQATQRACLFWEQSKRLKEQEGIQNIALSLSIAKGMKAARNSAEEKLLKQILKDTNFNIHEVARRLNLKRENVYYLMNKYGITRKYSELR